MTRDEAKKIIGIMMATYPNYNPSDLTLTINTWCALFKDMPYKNVETALQTFILSDSRGFAPAPGQLMSVMSQVAQNNELNDQEAWAKVSTALRDGIYHAKERFDELPPLIQKAVGSPENLHNWATSDFETIETVIASNFQRAYRSVLNRQAFEMKVSPISNRLESYRNNQMLIGDGNYDE